MLKKTCNVCNLELPHDSFCKNKARKDGLNTRCKRCDAVKVKESSQKRIEAKYAYNTKWYKSNIEKDRIAVEKNHTSVPTAIYMIKNIINGKSYIGASIKPYRRVKQHLSYHQPESRICGSIAIANEIDTYGKESFVWGVMEYVSREFLRDRERYYINQYKPEYNLNEVR
jgi:hypothetical protein